MPSSPKPFELSVETIDLMRARFTWNGNSGPDREKKQKKQSYSAGLRIFPKEKDDDVTFTHLSAFCDFRLYREGYASANFDLTATYYFSLFHDIPGHTADLETFRRIAATLVWTRFFEYARFSLSQAGIEDVNIPIEPGDISVQTVTL